MELVTMNNHEPPTHLVFDFLRWCAVRSTSSHSSTCICDWESRPPEPSFSAIVQWERLNKVVGKRSTWLLDRFSKFIITTHLSLHRSHVEPCHINRELRQSARNRQKSTTVKEDMYILNSRIMSFILNLLICIDMILLDSLLQYFMFIVVIELSSTFDKAIV
jgi:hypothetical protein